MSTPNKGANPSRPDKSLGELFAALQTDVKTLVTDQISLAKAELRESARNAGAAAALVGAALFLGVLALIFLFVTLAYVLVQLGLPVWAGFGIVTLLLLLVAAVLGLIARSRGSKVKSPERTARAMSALSTIRPTHDSDPASTATGDDVASAELRA